MIKKIAIVSLSTGVLGEPFVKHEYDLGLDRLNAMGCEVVFTENSCKGIDYLAAHPEKRAEDLLGALEDDSVDMILCAIGGGGGYQLLPYLFENDKLKSVAKQKVFLGFSDTTMHHFMLRKAGINTFYGQAFLPDVAELDKEMLPYSKHYFEELIKTGTISKITPSEVWYEERTSFDESQLGVPKTEHKDAGFIHLSGSEKFSGKILGGCIELLNSMIDEESGEAYQLSEKYNLFPSLEEWTGKILLLETSDGKSSPKYYEHMLNNLKAKGIFDVVSGVIAGKPIDEVYMEEYKDILLKVIDNPSLPVVYNINIGHSTPRCIIPLGVDATVDVGSQMISFN